MKIPILSKIFGERDTGPQNAAAAPTAMARRPSGAYKGALPTPAVAQAPLTPAEQKELTPRHIPPPPEDVLERVPVPPSATFLAVARAGGVHLPKRIRKAIQEFDDEWLKLMDVVLDNTPDAARQRFQAQNADLHLHGADKIGQHAHRSREDFDLEAAARRAAARKAQHAISVKALELFRPSAAEFAAAAEALAQRIEVGQADLFAEFGLEYKGDFVSLSIRKAGKELIERVKGDPMGNRPLHILSGIPLLELPEPEPTETESTAAAV